MPETLAQPPQVRRRWFQFRLRTLLIVVAVLCFVFACSARSLEWIKQRQHFLHTAGVGFFLPIEGVTAPGGLWMFGEFGVAELIVDEDHPNRKQVVERGTLLFPEAKITYESKGADRGL